MNSPTRVVRQAEEHDAPILGPLLLASAPETLPYMLGTDAAETERFLTHALGQPHGQFGYQNHFVVAENDEVLAMGTVWHKHLPKDFDKQTLLSLQSYFDTERAVGIVARSSALSAFLPSPQSTELGLGHIVVAESHRRSGAGTMLLNHFEALAFQFGLTRLSLNVDYENQRARQFYRALGFQEESEFTLPTGLLSNISGFIRCAKPL